MNYGELKTSLARLSHRTDLTEDWPDFIRRAHDIITDEVALVADMTIANRDGTLPTDLSLVLSVWIEGAPVDFSVTGGILTACVSPAHLYDAKVLYRPSKAFFADDAATNTVLTEYSWVYRYGALAEAGRFARDNDAAMQNEAAFRGEIERITSASTMAAANQIKPRAGRPTP